jgi:hydroxymethylpyrimidine pyrophosphatase-like HAD family hydrolase
MKFGALALDYDGTIASDGVLDPAVREAISEVRQRGVLVSLVTGRRLDDLRRVVGELTCFDVVVAENGGVLHFPLSGRHAALGHPPHPRVLGELQRRGVPFTAGEVVVETDATFAPVVLEIIHKLEQPLVLAFNRSRLMVLPQGIAKSTGLRQALFALRTSIHNAVAIGDAENDHDLLDACEVGAAVAWGSNALREVADEVVAGTGPSAVADYIRRLAAQPRLSAAQMGRRRLLLGHELNGTRVELAVRGRTILIAGEPGTGKSWLAGLICEQLVLQGYCLCIVDPEGDYRALGALPNVITLGGDDPPPHTREIERALHPDVSVVIDLSRQTHSSKLEYLHGLLPVLMAIRRRSGVPHKILLDEAHYFLRGPDSLRLIDPELEGYIFVTYRISRLDPSVRGCGESVVLVTRETDPHEIETLADLCRPTSSARVLPETFTTLKMTEAALLPGALEAQGVVRRFQLAPRLTAHVRHRTKYLDMPVAEAHAFVFMDDGRVGPRARTLKEFIALLESQPERGLEQHLQRHDFSRWIDAVFRDHPIAAHVRGMEEAAGIDAPRTIAERIAQAIRSRYE